MFSVVIWFCSWHSLGAVQFYILFWLQLHSQELKGHGDLAADLRHDVPASRADSSLTTEFSSSTVQASDILCT